MTFLSQVCRSQLGITVLQDCGHDWLITLETKTKHKTKISIEWKLERIDFSGALAAFDAQHKRNGGESPFCFRPLVLLLRPPVPNCPCISLSASCCHTLGGLVPSRRLYSVRTFGEAVFTLFVWRADSIVRWIFSAQSAWQLANMEPLYLTLKITFFCLSFMMIIVSFYLVYIYLYGKAMKYHAELVS